MGQFIGEALESVGKQSCPNWEVIAVDDCGPEDGTKEAVEDFAKKFPDHRILYHRHEKNAGVSAARNTAIGMAQGQYLAFLDPDDWWEDNYLIKQMELLTSGSDLDLVYSGVCFVDFKGEEIDRFTPSSYFLAAFPKSLFCNNEIHLSTVIVRKELVMAVGGFDCSSELQHIEDWDLWIRLAVKGSKFSATENSLVNYRRHSQSASLDSGKMWQRTLSLMRKHRGEPGFVEALYERGHNLQVEISQMKREFSGLKSIYENTINRKIRKFFRIFCKN
jgi:glycosyltransferase involved in cell wall biosynthesis